MIVDGGRSKGVDLFGPESLGRYTAMRVRSLSVKTQKTEDDLKRIEFESRVAEHLGGFDKLDKDQQIVDRYSDPTALYKQYEQSNLGFIGEWVKLVGPDNKQKDIAFEEFQLEALYCGSEGIKIVALKKARRIGGSLAYVWDALANLHLRPGIPSFIMARSLNESKFRMEDEYRAYDSIPVDIRSPMYGGRKKSRLDVVDRLSGRITSSHAYPQIDPRGIEGFMYFDEIAFWRDQITGIKAGAMTILSTGYAWLVSSAGERDDPFTLIHQLITRIQAKADTVDLSIDELGDVADATMVDLIREGGARALTVPWYDCRRMVIDGDVETARREAPLIANTEERIQRFGSQRLKTIFYFMLQGDIVAFENEEECKEHDSANAYYAGKLLNDSAFDPEVVGHEVDLEEVDESPSKGELVMKSRGIHRFLATNLVDLAQAVKQRRIGQGQFILGVDAGDTDGWGLVLLELIRGLLIVRYRRKWRKKDVTIGKTYDAVEGEIIQMGDIVPIWRVGIDFKTGQGGQLVQSLRVHPRFGTTAVYPVEGTLRLNHEMGIDLKIRLERSQLFIPDDRGITIEDEYSLFRDVGKVRKVKKVGQWTIEVKRDASGHGDLFYALIYGLAPLPRAIRMSADDPMVTTTPHGGLPAQKFGNETTGDSVGDLAELYQEVLGIRPGLSDFHQPGAHLRPGQLPPTPMEITRKGMVVGPGGLILPKRFM